MTTDNDTATDTATDTAINAMDYGDTFALLPFIVDAGRDRLLMACAFVATTLHADGSDTDDMVSLLGDLPSLDEDELADMLTDLVDPICGDDATLLPTVARILTAAPSAGAWR